MLRDGGKKPGFPIEFAATQIKCRAKTVRKLSRFLRNEQFLFPSALSAEQATHQCVASYHASLVGSGHRVLDMTAGLGIDAMTIAANGNHVTAIELDPDRAAALEHNLESTCSLGSLDMEVIEADSIAWLADQSRHNCTFDAIFIDPARRNSANQRTYFFADCVPDIVSNRELILANTHRLFIKASPIIDLTQALREFPAISQFHIVCINGECKEVLAIANTLSPTPDPSVIVVDLKDNQEGKVEFKSRFECSMSDLSNEAPIAESTDFEPGHYLYDPNAGLHKLNCASIITQKFGSMRHVAKNTDLYVSTEYYSDFPGRVFEISGIIEGKSSKTMAGLRKEVAVRNYPLSAEELRKKLKVRPGGNGQYLWGFRAGEKNSPVLINAQLFKKP